MLSCQSFCRRSSFFTINITLTASLLLLTNGPTFCQRKASYGLNIGTMIPFLYEGYIFEGGSAEQDFGAVFGGAIRYSLSSTTHLKAELNWDFAKFHYHFLVDENTGFYRLSRFQLPISLYKVLPNKKATKKYPWMLIGGVGFNFLQRGHNDAGHLTGGYKYTSTVTFIREISPELLAGVGKNLTDKLSYQISIHYSLYKEYNAKAVVFRPYEQFISDRDYRNIRGVFSINYYFYNKFKKPKRVSCWNESKPPKKRPRKTLQKTR